MFTKPMRPTEELRVYNQQDLVRELHHHKSRLRAIQQRHAGSRIVSQQQDCQQQQGLMKVDQHDDVDKIRTAGIFDHFMNGYVPAAAGKWNTGTTGGASSVTLSSTLPGGKLVLTAGAVQNDEAWVYQPTPGFQFLANQPQMAICNLYYTEGNVNLAGIAFGWASSWTHILADTTWALPTTLSGALVYKIPGGTNWNVFGSVGTTQYTQQGTALCQNAAIPQTLAIYAMMDQAGNVELTFWAFPVGINANPAYPWVLPNLTNMGRYQIAKFYIPYASAAAMQLGLFVKSGDAGGTAETVYLDAIGGEFLSIP